MLSEQQLQRIAEQTYWVERNRDDVIYHPEHEGIYLFDRDNISIGQFQVLKVTDNTENGMQAMAVAL